MTQIFNHLGKASTAAILAILWTLLAGVIFILVLVGKVTATEAMVSIILQGVISIITYIVGYYHGSSEKKKPEKAE